MIHYVANTMTNQLIAEPTINESDAAVEALGTVNTISNRLDYVVFGLFIGLVLGMIFSNVWDTVTQSSIFGTTVANFPITNNIMGNLPLYLGIIGIIGLVVMFAKPYVVGQE